MAMFQYRVLMNDGALVDGSLEAPGRQDALRALEARGLTPISLAEVHPAAPGEAKGISLPWRSRRVSHRELENFTRMLASLLAAGVPLSRALVIIHKETVNPTARDLWKAVHGRVIDGISLADAMAQSPETFPRVYTAMVQAGETGGFLDIVLGQIADFQLREKDLRAKVAAALIYPAVLMVLAVSVLIFLLIFFIPRFQSIFSGFGAALPWITRLIVAVSEIVRMYGWIAGLGIGLGLYLAGKWIQTERGKRQWDEWILQLPVFGPLAAKFAMARFCRMLGTLLSAGVPLIHSLNVARKSINNQVLVDTVSGSIEKVKQGGRLAASLSDCRQLFAGSVLEMIAVSEETGRLDQELIRLAAVTEQDLDRHLKTAVALAEPLMLFLIAGFIGTIFIGMVIPIFTIQDYIK
ncbi:MAG: type II secretion system F family protein [bacterium]